MGGDEADERFVAEEDATADADRGDCTLDGESPKRGRGDAEESGGVSNANDLTICDRAYVHVAGQLRTRRFSAQAGRSSCLQGRHLCDESRQRPGWELVHRLHWGQSCRSIHGPIAAVGSPAPRVHVLLHVNTSIATHVRSAAAAYASSSSASCASGCSPMETSSA